MATTALLGCTGMVGGFILSTLRHSAVVSRIDVMARRALPEPSQSDSKIHAFVNADTSTWATHLSSLSPTGPSILFSGLATTRAAAGSFEAQYALEHDVNLALARAAKESGSTKVYVLISSQGADPNAFVAYSKMKGELEENVKALGFDHTVILRPGLIAGQREEKRALEAGIRKVADLLGKVSQAWLKDPWAQEAEVIGRAAVQAGLMALNGQAPEGKDKVWVLAGKDIIRLGRTEWKE